jgi:hypothetical protein
MHLEDWPAIVHMLRVPALLRCTSTSRTACVQISRSHLTALTLGVEQWEDSSHERDVAIGALVQALCHIPRLFRLHFLCSARPATDAGVQYLVPQRCMAHMWCSAHPLPGSVVTGRTTGRAEVPS